MYSRTLRNTYCFQYDCNHFNFSSFFSSKVIPISFLYKFSMRYGNVIRSGNYINKVRYFSFY